MKKKIVLSFYLLAMLVVAIMIAPQSSQADEIAYDEMESFQQEWCDWIDWKNKWLSVNCKPKTGHVCETTNCEVIIE